MDQIHLYLQLAQSRMASGALLEPSDDNARTYISSALRLAPDDEDVRAMALSLGEAFTASFRKALADGDSAAAEHWLKASRSYTMSEATLDQMSMQLGGFEVAHAAQLTADQAIANADTTAAVSVESPAVAAYPQIVPESSLRRLIFVPPIYPHEALVRGDTGVVELDFTVTPKGSVADVKVTAAEPAGMFEEAATSALLHDRYQPVQRDGVNVSQRAHIRMRFAL
jgi:TonB family protein